MAELANGGTSWAARTSSASTRPSASSTGTVSAASGRTAASTRARASATEMSEEGTARSSQRRPARWYQPGMARDPSPRPRRPRPVADAPVELAERGEALAKGWLLELLDAAPLEAAAALPAVDFAREAPALCAAVVRALASEAELDRLRPDGDLYELAARAGALCGAGDTATAAAGMRALRAVTWAAVRDELRAADADLVAELAERLAHVEEAVLEAVLSGAEAALVPPRPAARGAWREDLAARVADADAGGPALAVMLVEIDGAERLVASEGEAQAALLIARASDAVRAALRPGDAIHEEDGARLWILAGGLERGAAGALAARVGWAVEDAVEVAGRRSPLRSASPSTRSTAPTPTRSPRAPRRRSTPRAPPECASRGRAWAGPRSRPGPWLVR